MAKILVVDDDSTFCLMLKAFLTRNGHKVTDAFSYDKAYRAINDNKFDVVLTDFRLPEKSGLDVLIEAKKKNRDTVVVIMTGYGDIRMAVKTIKHGAFDYVTKPVNPEEILATINNALSSVSAGEPSFDDPYTFIEGKSQFSQELMRHISIVAPTNLSVIIQGESGTGKEFVARQIHKMSKRKGKPFVAIDCGALPRELAASEFFGHVKGSFTGAIADKVGQFEVANGGTLFLDEIGNLPYEVQVNLLRAIQERKIKRIGSSKEIPVDVRIIVATNDDLVSMVSKGAFREDLFHRLNEFSIRIAPLSERKDDMMVYARWFLMQANRELGKNISGFDSNAIDAMLNYSWPGNIRELRNAIRRAVLLEQTQNITIGSLPYDIVGSIHKTNNSKTPDLKNSKEKAEKELIISTLEKVKYNKTKAAKLLNIDRKTLYNKIKQYGIES
ncbi:sigma-54-dependent transcriptional regulator [Tenuifilum thalassicum]|uniref:Sigma-54-dependent Fis family transcriptional regulator n=1 Tax=Tenuifilum thalassicum TaxID=2590900 RepID=A0A7D4BQH8_9BACT|nr:sigma-54 dependent transcriptional regulator [Tenuifilum thalassicum]QKG78781.1 sigma-54-dependent Fis family transcriptional regulator [Tenuifilum thalassicum]